MLGSGQSKKIGLATTSRVWCTGPFPITVLKVLAGQPSERASLADLKRAMAILIFSGPDWTNRTRSLAAQAPDLDIFSQSLLLRDTAGWEITDLGRAFLDCLATAPIK